MSKSKKRDSRISEIVERLNKNGEGWKKYDEISGNQVLWNKQKLKVEDDVTLLCLENYDKSAGLAWEKSGEWLRAFDPDREHRDGSKVGLGDYLRKRIGQLKKKVKDADRYDPGERKARDARRKKEERKEKKKDRMPAEKERGIGNVQLDTVTGRIVAEDGTQNESLSLASAATIEEQMIEKYDKEKGDKFLSDLAITMMAMCLNFKDYRKQLQKRGKAGSEIYTRMWYTERLVWLEIVEQILYEMDRNMQKDVLKAMLKSYYWYWADGKMVYDAEQEGQKIRAEKIVTPEIKNLKWMKGEGDKNKGWLEAKIPIGYLEKAQGKKAADSSISESRDRYEKDLYALYEMAYGREKRSQPQKSRVIVMDGYGGTA
ncbi:MAG TPA: hypothetical protein DF613_04655 [Lachnospiraceae bacterium]|nr:hypothetical protein [Lachnospiraceae bacterium]